MTNSNYILGDDYRDPKHGCLVLVVAVMLTVLCCIFFGGCKSQYMPGTDTETSINVRDREVPVYTPSDSASIRDTARTGDRARQTDCTDHQACLYSCHHTRTAAAVATRFRLQGGQYGAYYPCARQHYQPLAYRSSRADSD